MHRCNNHDPFYSILVGAGTTDEPGMLREVHNMLHVLVKRVEGTEKELKEMKKQMAATPSTPIHKRKAISPIVRVRSLLGFHTQTLTKISEIAV